MNSEKDFDYELTNGEVTHIGTAETNKFLKIGQFSSKKDRRVSSTAIANIDRAYEWCDQLRVREGK